jgi:hypothetical protein
MDQKTSKFRIFKQIKEEIMNLTKKQVLTIGFAVLLALAPLSASAMTCSDHTDAMGWDADHGTSGNQTMLHGIDQSTAEHNAVDYVCNRYDQTFRMSAMTDMGAYYQTEARNPSGEVLERLMIDKETGHINSRRHN